MATRNGPASPEAWEGLVQEAERRGYLEFHGEHIRYKCAVSREENYGGPEEKVRAGVYSWLILEREYPATSIKIEVLVPRRTPSDYADIVVFTDSSCRTPYLVVETKRSQISQSDYRRAIEQAFGNANSLRDTALALVDNGATSSLYAVAGYPHDEREENLLGTRDDVPKCYGNVSQFPLVAGEERDIRPLPSRDVENRVRNAHAIIWAGGKRDPLTAFDEWSKLLFAKIYDERHTASGEPRQFQVGRREEDVTTGNRVRSLYGEARNEDPTIFSAPLHLSDDKIAQVVRTVEPVAFTRMDVDALGNAFEGFFGSIFRGELGQYFTRREIVRFVCALLKPTEADRVLDPTAGSGGFLLETLIQVWRHIDVVYAGQEGQERRKFNFASNRVYGIEIFEKLGRICQTNLILHKDGHTNIEVDRSCLDSDFTNPFLDPSKPQFTLIIGNPPFGDNVKEGDRDHLGGNSLRNFEIPTGDQVASEIAILERSINWLTPGSGRLGMVVPDGLLNNPGERSLCPAFRRFLFHRCRVLAIVSLPDYAFRKSGAQNKTSVLFLRRLSEREERRMESVIKESGGAKRVGVARALKENDYSVFLAEAETIGFNSSGISTEGNDLYSQDGTSVVELPSTVIGQFRLFENNPTEYGGSDEPNLACLGVPASQLFGAHPSSRIDPKYHIFKIAEEVTESPPGTTTYRLGNLLERRVETVVPSDYPDTEFLTVTLSQKGEFTRREAGKGRNPPSWRGAYFKEGQGWNRIRAGGVLFSRIDLWKGCIGVVPAEFDGAVVTNEFPVYYLREESQEKVDIRYLQLLLRTTYCQRAVRAITTGHSNRRRTQEIDFENLTLFFPALEMQRDIVERVDKAEADLVAARITLANELQVLDRTVREIASES